MNLAFNASAGTGKTHQIAELYVCLVMGRPCRVSTAEGDEILVFEPDPQGNPVNPGKILVMTFTENAAAELRARITGLLIKEQRLAQTGANDAAERHAAEALRSLAGARISTIHSFCSRFLREHAISAGVSPRFTILDDDESRRILEQASIDQLLRSLNKNAATYDGDLERFCWGMPPLSGRGVIGMAQTLLSRALSMGVNLENAPQWLPAPSRTVTVADFDAVCRRLEEIKSLRAGELPAAASAAYDALKRFLEQPRGNTLEPGMDALAAATARSIRGNNGVSEAGSLLKTLVDKAVAESTYAEHYPTILAFVEFAARLSSSCSDRKTRLSVLGFDDLLLRTRDLLQAERLRGASDFPFDFIIVDEAQDTSRIQCDIINALWRPGSNKLVICGDPKQSIYAWRNADPQVMPELERRIADTGSFKSVPLRRSYRSKDTVIDFTNRLFGIVYGDKYRGQELVPLDRALTRQRREGPCVELLVEPWDANSDETAQPSTRDRVTAEMTAVARRIRLLVERNREGWRPKFRYDERASSFDPEGPTNAFRYSDIMILMRRTTYLHLLERALHRHEIPYSLGGKGRGFFSRTEVLDISLFLKALVYPTDVAALIAFLRSPWVGMSDDAIARIAWTGKGFANEGIMTALSGTGISANSRPSLNTEDAGRLDKARAILKKYSLLAHQLLPSELIRQLIRDTGYDAVLAGLFRGNQRVRNLRKAIDWLRKAERGAITTLADVTDLLQKHAEDPPEVSEAPLTDPEQNVVTIMTVHGAKGLTSNVVFVPDMGTVLASDGQWAHITKSTEGATAMSLLMRDVSRQTISTPGYDEAVSASKAVREEENRNALYVAVTRARDLVVLSGSRGRIHGSWRETLDALMSGQSDNQDVIRTIGYETLAAECPVSSRCETGHVPRGEDYDGASSHLHRKRECPAILRYPATALASRLTAPAELPRCFTDAPSTDNEAGTSYHALETDSFADAESGAIGHAVLEQVSCAPALADIDALMRSIPEAAVLSECRSKALREKLEKCREWLVHALSKAEPGTIHAEWPFSMKLVRGNTILIVDGIVDLAWKDLNGPWRILDYKFTDALPESTVPRHALQLNLYAEALARHLGVSPQSIACHLLIAGKEAAKDVPVGTDTHAVERAVEIAEMLDEHHRAEL